MSAASDPRLEHIQYSDTRIYVPRISSGRVIKVYDGDTITIGTYLQGDDTLYRFSVRLKGIDCPEMRTRNSSEKECALLSKAFVADKVMDTVVRLENIELEKYGRLLADVYCTNGECLNDLLCQQRLAVKYDGGTKQVPDDWMKYYNGQ